MTEKLTKTVAVVKAPREFETGDGKPLTGHDVIFDDGDEGGVVTNRNADDVAAMHEALEGLKGKTIEFEVDGNRVYNNTTIWKVKNFPGKPRGTGGGGGGGGRKDWVDTSPSVEAQTALKQAVFALGTYNPEIHSDGITEYIGLVRQTALGFARTLVDAKKITSFGQPAPEEQKQEQAPAAAPSTDGLRPMQQDAVAVFGSKAKVQIAYKKMFGEGHKFEDIDDESLMALIDEKGASE